MAAPAKKTSASPRQDEGDGLLFSRVGVRSEDDPQSIKKARITAVNGEALEAVTEGSWESLRLDAAAVGTDFYFIDETQWTRPAAVAASAAAQGHTDFGFLLQGKTAFAKSEST